MTDKKKDLHNSKAAALSLFLLLFISGIPIIDAAGQTSDGDEIPVETNYPPGEIEWKMDLSVGSSGYVGMPCFVDLEGDGFIETLTVGTSYDPEDWTDTTELYCLDHLGNVRWRYKTAGNRYSSSLSPIVCDLDGDGEIEIILIGASGDWSDQRAVITCLDPSSNLKWEVNITSEWIYTSPVVANLDRKPGLEMIITSWNKVTCLDQSGKMLWSIKSDNLNLYQSPTIADIYNNGQMHVILPTWNALICLDGDPSDGTDEGSAGIEPFEDSEGGADVLWYRQWEEDYWIRDNMDHISVGDLGGDGRLELVASGDRGQTVCLNADGNTIWESEIQGMTGSPTIGDVDGDGSPEILGMVDPFKWDWIEPYDDKTDPDDPRPEDWQYKIVCLEGGNGTELWRYPTNWGGRTIILGDTDGDADLEIFFSSENNILAVDGDEDGNGVLDEEEVLWKFSSGSISGWSSSFLLGDVDHDGQLELVTSAGELIYCLSVGGKCPLGTIEWGKPYFDLQNTNRYQSGLRSGVRIFPSDSMDGEKRTMVGYGEIGEVVSFGMTVKNTGSYASYYGPSPGVDFKETFDIFPEAIPPGWWATLDRYEVRLGPDETAVVKMEVKIPQGALLDTSANIRVMVQSRNDPFVNDTQETVTIIKGLYNVHLSCADPIRGDSVPTEDISLKPGDAALFRVTATNLGEADDTIIFTMEESEQLSVEAVLPNPNGPYEINLGGGESRDFLLFVKTANDIESGPWKFNITACSKGNINISDTLTLTVLINSISEGVHLSCDDPYMTIDPSGSVHFTITAVNTLSRSSRINLNLTWNPSHFRCFMNMSHAVIDPGSSVRINLTVSAPDNILADILCSISLRSLDVDDPRNYDVLMVYTVVRHVYDIKFSVPADPVSVLPDSSGTFPVETRNMGNGFDHYRIEIDNLSGGFGLSFSEFPETLHPITDDRQVIVINITTPTKTTAGIYVINISCVSEGGKEIRNSLILVVKEVLGVSLSVDPSDSFISPGSNLALDLTIRNLGNSRREYLVSVLNDRGLDIDFTDTVILDSFGLWRDQIEISAPVGIDLGRRSIGISALTETHNGTIGNATQFSITVIGTDLSWDSGSLRLEVSDSEDLISVKGKIINSGNKPARDVVVRLYPKGSSEPLVEVSLDIMYWESEISVHWLNGGSDMEIVAVIDPDNTVPEINEGNNEETLDLSRSSSGIDGSHRNRIVNTIIWISSALIILLIVFLLIKRREEL